jgi:hypothetical protein
LGLIEEVSIDAKVKPSMACVKASIPVDAVLLGGMERVS